jgi:hypothetical protein
MVGNTPLFEIAHLLDCKINRMFSSLEVKVLYPT